MPYPNTFRIVLCEVVPLSELQQLFPHYLHECFGGQRSQLVSMDGKTMRGTILKYEQQGVPLLVVYLPEKGIVLAQIAVDSKENEVCASPRSISHPNLRHRIMCGEALLTQRELSAVVLAQRGAYIWFLKDNHPTMRGGVEQLSKATLKAAGWRAPTLESRTATSMTKGHGRLQGRLLARIADETGFLDWFDLRPLFQLRRLVLDEQTGEVITEDVRHGIIRLVLGHCTASQLVGLIQSYWGIQDGLHHRRDVTLQDDGAYISQHGPAEAIAAPKNFVIGLLRKQGFTNLVSVRRCFDTEIASYLALFV
ncbi:MAG: ISAs1 family transposase [Candidatus Promineifilaceae bacterium]|nr:ISAs1 family transposase [Candidatus Promineifilaceae bacterium]